jgi:hypothetical protein
MHILQLPDFATSWAVRPKKPTRKIDRHRRRLAKTSTRTTLVGVDAPDPLAAAIARYAQLYKNIDARAARVLRSAWLTSRAGSTWRSCAGLRRQNLPLPARFGATGTSPHHGRRLPKQDIDDCFARFSRGVIEFYKETTIDPFYWASAGYAAPASTEPPAPRNCWTWFMPDGMP